MAEVNGHNVNTSEVLTTLGCGTLGSAILHGLLASKAEEKSEDGKRETLSNGCGTPTSRTEGKVAKPIRFIACVRTKESATRLGNEFPSQTHVKVSHGDNIHAIKAASTVILGCQSQDFSACLGEPGVANALQGKFLISILAGVTIPQIESYINSSLYNGAISTADKSTTIIRAMPNTSALHHSSTTLITYDHSSTPSSHLALATNLLSTVGTVYTVPSHLFDAHTALCGSTPAFFALFIDALLDGAVALGIKRNEAKALAAETMRGVAEGLIMGGDVGEVREKVCTPGGSSIQGLLIMERNGIRCVIADALCKAAGAAGGLGQK